LANTTLFYLYRMKWSMEKSLAYAIGIPVHEMEEELCDPVVFRRVCAFTQACGEKILEIEKAR